ncbi:MAG: hypothetical protein QXU98_06610 [Candidatus Parvarchaeota archaeon]
MSNMQKIFIEISFRINEDENMVKKRIKIILEVIPGAIISLPISFYLASAEIRYHPFWHTFAVAFLGIWFLIFAGVWYYFWAVGFRNAIRNRKPKR